MNEETTDYQKYKSKNKLKQIMIKRFQEKLFKILEKVISINYILKMKNLISS